MVSQLVGCSTCNGTGKFSHNKKPCTSCGGKGYHGETREFDIHIPGSQINPPDQINRTTSIDIKSDPPPVFY